MCSYFYRGVRILYTHAYKSRSARVEQVAINFDPPDDKDKK